VHHRRDDPGTYTFTANYPGDTNFTGSSDTTSVTVVPSATATTLTDLSLNTYVSARRSPSPRPWRPRAGHRHADRHRDRSPTASWGGQSCTIALASATTCTIVETTPGTYTFTANYPGDTNFTGSSDTTSVTVVPSATATTLTDLSLNTYVSGQTITVTATVAPLAPAPARRPAP